MKPNLAVLRLDYAADPKDFEAFICNGKSVYAYNGLQKTITEHKLPDPKTNPAGETGNLILDFVSGMKAKDLKARFDIEAVQGRRRTTSTSTSSRCSARTSRSSSNCAWHSTGRRHGQVAYLPAQVYMVKPNDETEQWKLSSPKTDIAGDLTAKVFEFENVPGFRFQKAPDDGAAAGGADPASRPRRCVRDGHERVIRTHEVARDNESRATEFCNSHQILISLSPLSVTMWAGGHPASGVRRCVSLLVGGETHADAVSWWPVRCSSSG